MLAFARALVKRLRATDPIVIGFLALAALALAIRIALIDQTTQDVLTQEGWLHFLEQNGGVRALGLNIPSDNYTPFYSYLLLLGSHLQFGLSDLVAVKYASIAADFICAVFVFRIVRLRYPQGHAPLIASVMTLLTPTVIANSSYWGQTDMIWVAPLVAALYYVLKGRDLAAVIAFGVAFAFKPLAIFFLPFLVLLAFKEKLRWRTLFAAPVVYFVSIVPAWIAGRSFTNLMTIYAHQEQYFPQFNYHAPNVYAWITSTSHPRASWMWGAAVIGLALMLVAAVKFTMTPALLVAFATASVIFAPFVLPRMHERYFFAADVLSIVLAFYVPRLFPVALIVQLTSFFVYVPYLFKTELFSVRVLALFELTAIVLLFVWIARELRSQQLSPESGAETPAA